MTPCLMNLNSECEVVGGNESEQTRKEKEQSLQMKAREWKKESQTK